VTGAVTVVSSKAPLRMVTLTVQGPAIPTGVALVEYLPSPSELRCSASGPMPY
jgi:hypothetical protein